MSDFYRRSAERYIEEMPSIGYVDILARRSLSGDRKALSELAGWLAGIAEAVSYKKAHIARYRGVERDDMRQAAMLAMLEGLQTWDPTKSAYRTYAFNLAHFAVLNILNESFIVSVPRNIACAVQSSFASEASSASRDIKRARPETLDAARAAIQPTLTIKTRDHDPSEAGSAEVNNGYAREVEDIEQGYENAITNLCLKQVVDQSYGSTEQERKALAARFGFLGERKEAMPRLAEEEGVSTQQIYNRANKGLSRLRWAVKRKGAA